MLLGASWAQWDRLARCPVLRLRLRSRKTASHCYVIISFSSGAVVVVVVVVVVTCCTIYMESVYLKCKYIFDISHNQPFYD